MTDTTKILTHYDLSHANTMALSCVARHAMILDSDQRLADDLAVALAFAKNANLPIFVLSGGSNVILPSTLNALVLLPKTTGIQLISQTEQSVTLQVACGENWHQFIQTCLNQGYYGLENLALIPGLVGACPVQNIGAYGVQVSDFIDKVIAYDLQTGQACTFDNTACDFGYRHSFFKDNPNRYLISHVVFRLQKAPNILTNYGDLADVSGKIASKNGRTTPTPMDVFDAVVQIRQSKLPDPAVLANCGSFFQNPVIPIKQFHELKAKFSDLPSYLVNDDFIKLPAGWLIDKAGLKGKGIFPILTHEKQALVLTNHRPRRASQHDIKTTQDFIINAVKTMFGVSLVREPVWLDEHI